MSEILAGALMGLGDGLVNLAREQKQKAAEKRDIELKRYEYEALANDPEATRSQRARARAGMSALDRVYGGEQDGERVVGHTWEKTRAGQSVGLPRRGSAKDGGSSPRSTGTSDQPKADRPAGLGTRPVSREEGMQPEATRELERLATLSPEAYEAQRRRVADRLGWRLTALDARVAAIRKNRSSSIDKVPEAPKDDKPGTAAPAAAPTSAPPPGPSMTAPAMPQDRAAPAGPSQKPTEESSVLDEARAAIRQGAPRDAVIARLRELGVDPKGL